MLYYRTLVPVVLICCTMNAATPVYSSEFQLPFKAPVACLSERIKFTDTGIILPKPPASCGQIAEWEAVRASAIKIEEDRLRCNGDSACDREKMRFRMETTQFEREPCKDKIYATGDEWVSSSFQELADVYRGALDGALVQDRILVEVSDWTGDERQFASCEVTSIGDLRGPPRKCIAVALAKGDEVYRRVGIPTPAANDSDNLGKETICLASASFSPTGNILVDFTVKNATSLDVFGRSIEKSLEMTLKFATRRTFDNENHIAIASTSGLRDSLILPSLREALDMSVSLGKRNDREISVRAETTPLVCRTASGNLHEYRGLNDAERATYASVFNNYLKSAIIEACGQLRNADDHTIECN